MGDNGTTTEEAVCLFIGLLMTLDLLNVMEETGGLVVDRAAKGRRLPAVKEDQEDKPVLFAEELLDKDDKEENEEEVDDGEIEEIAFLDFFKFS